MEQVALLPGTTNILRYPRLDTVLMVERFIKEYDGEYKKRKLWESLPKKTMYQTFMVIIDYLLYSKKISIDAEGKIGWIYYPDDAKSYYVRKDLGRRKCDSHQNHDLSTKTSKKHSIILKTGTRKSVNYSKPSITH